MKVVCREQCIVEELFIADTFFKRLRGLIGRKPLKECQGLLITPCNGVHTWFMGYPIDIVFLDGHDRVVQIFHDVVPWKMTRIIKDSIKVIEIRSGQHEFVTGEQVTFL